VFEIADLGSTNGTKINGTLIERPFTLNDGDTLRLFDVELNYETLKSRERTRGPSAEPQTSVD
jgi:pSer/pThr/pTyr-binding forkhead associated (FHA) protein